MVHSEIVKKNVTSTSHFEKIEKLDSHWQIVKSVPKLYIYILV